MVSEIREFYHEKFIEKLRLEFFGNYRIDSDRTLVRIKRQLSGSVDVDIRFKMVLADDYS